MLVVSDEVKIVATFRAIAVVVVGTVTVEAIVVAASGLELGLTLVY